MSTARPHQVRVTRRFSVPPERIFDAWLIPQQFQSWMSDPPQVEVSDVQIDSRPGGSLYFVERRDGEVVEMAGQILEMTRPNRLVLTWGPHRDTRGLDPITVEIFRLENGAELHLTHELPPDRTDDTGHIEALWRLRLDLLSWDQEERARAEPTQNELLQRLIALQEKQSADLEKIRWRTGCLYAWLILGLMLGVLGFLASLSLAS